MLLTCGICGKQEADGTECGWLVKEPDEYSVYVHHTTMVCPDCMALRDEMELHECKACYNHSSFIARIHGRWMWWMHGQEVDCCPYCGEKLDAGAAPMEL